MKFALAISLVSLVLGGSAVAKKKPKKKVDAVEEVRKKETPPPPPGDKSSNEGAQGRKNATEDASKGVDSPSFERRP
jgi:hypothetical protein